MSDKDVQRLAYAAAVREHIRGVLDGTRDGGLSLPAIGRGAGVSRTPLSMEAGSCEVIKALRVEIVNARAELKRRASKTSTSGSGEGGDAPPTGDQLRSRARENAKPGLDTLPEAALATRIRQTKRQAQKAMETWLSFHGRLASVDDAWLAWDDLERLVWRLRRIGDELGPLLELRETHSAEETPVPPPAGIVRGGQGTLDL